MGCFCVTVLFSELFEKYFIKMFIFFFVLWFFPNSSKKSIIRFIIFFMSFKKKIYIDLMHSKEGFTKIWAQNCPITSKTKFLISLKREKDSSSNTKWKAVLSPKVLWENTGFKLSDSEPVPPISEFSWAVDKLI